MACNNIIITHFINPHLFWFHEVDTPEYENAKAIVADIEKNLVENCAHNKSNWQRLLTRQPEVGEIIVVHYVPWQRFIRGRVDEIAEYRRTAEEYIVWAIDYGFPLQTKLEHVHVLPKELNTPIQHIKRGGLANLLPAEKEFLRQQCVIMCTAQWHHTACDIVLDLVTKNYSVLFEEQFQTTDHHWGELLIIKDSGKKVLLASKLLLERQFAKEVKNFKQLCIRLKTVRICAWLNNNGNCNYKHNRSTGLPLKDEFVKSRMLTVDNADNAERKVIDWLQHLKIAKKDQMEKNDNANEAIPSYMEVSDIANQARPSYLGVNMLKKNMNADAALNKLLEDKQRRLAEPQNSVTFKLSKEAIAALDIDFELSVPMFEELNEDNISLNSSNESSTSKKNLSCATQCENNRASLGKSRTEIILELKQAASKSKNDNEKTPETSLDLSEEANVGQMVYVNRLQNIAEKRKKFLEFKMKDKSENENTFKEDGETIFDVSDLTCNKNFQFENKSSTINSASTSEFEADNQYTIEKMSSRINKILEAKKRIISESVNSSKSSAFDSTSTSEFEAMEKKSSRLSQILEAKHMINSKNENSFNENQAFLQSKSSVLNSSSTSEFEADNISNCMEIKSSRIYQLAHLRKKFFASKTASEEIEIKGEVVNPKFKAIPAGQEESVREIRNSDLHIQNLSTKNIKEENSSYNSSNCSKSNSEGDISYNAFYNCANKKTNSMKTEREYANFESYLNVLPAEHKDSVRDIRNSDTQTTYLSTAANRSLIVGNSSNSSTSSREVSVNKMKNYKETEQNNGTIKNYVEVLPAGHEVLAGKICNSNNMQQTARNLKFQQAQLISNSSASSKDEDFSYRPLKNVENKMDSSTNSEDNFTGFSSTTDTSCGEIPLSKLLTARRNVVKNAELQKYADFPYEAMHDTSKTSTTDESCKFLADASTDSGAIGDDEKDEVTPQSSSLRSLIAFRDAEKLKKQQDNKLKQQVQQLVHGPIRQIKELDNNTNQLVVPANEHAFKTSFIDQLVLVHSRENLHSIKRLEHAMLHHKIYKEMIHMDIQKLFRVQSYAWSHMTLSHSIFIVSAIKTGKTWAYMPLICHAVYNYLLLQKGLAKKSIPVYGPVALILVASTQHVEYVANICQRLLLNLASDVFVKVAACYGMRNASEVKVQLLNGCGILVATPASLWRLIADTNQAPLLSATRLQHIIIDDLDIMLSRSSMVFEQVLKNLMKLCANRKRTGADTQVVVTTRRWHPQLVNMLKNATQPILIFGDFLEAAVYGRVAFCIKLCTQDQKIHNIRTCLEQYNMKEQRTLIFCNSIEDVDVVVEALTACDYNCLVYDDRSKSSELDTLRKWQKSDMPAVVVCMDNAFYETDIKKVHNLIHYSMPSSWTQFTKRFSSISANLENCVMQNFNATTNDVSKCIKVSTLILLDEQNSEQLPRLLDFMRAHNQYKHVPEDIIVASKRVLQKRDETRVLDGWPLCTYLLEFGNCDEPNCNQRHAITRYDTLKSDSDIPSSGDLQIHIIKVNSPTHFFARLLNHRAVGETTWRQVRRSKEAATFGMQLNMHYTEAEHMTLFWPLKLRTICIYRNETNFQRAIILEMPTLKYPEVIQNVYVTVQLLDQGTILSHVQSYDLFACDDKFLDFPMQAVNVRLLGIIPYDDERTWDAYSTKMVEKWLMQNLKKQELVHVSVSCALANTIWVKNVLVMERLPSSCQFVQSLNLKKELLKEQLGCKCNDNENINELLCECELQQTDSNDDTSNLNATNEDEATDNTKEVVQIINTANLDENAENTKETAPIIKEYENAEKTKKAESKRNEDENSKESESIINEDENTKEAEPIAYIENTKNVEQSVIINMSKNVEEQPKILYAEKWMELRLHDITAVEMGNVNNNGHWKEILLQIYEKPALENYNKLSKLINEEVAIQKEQSKDNLKHALDLEWLQAKPCCIVRHEDSGYLRAKVLGVYGKNKDLLVRFFLCDFACFISKHIDSLHDDFLYNTTKEIVEYTPYQAVHCTLTGIDLFDLPTELHLLRKDYLSAYAVLKRAQLPKTLQELQINSYEILLYESDGEFITAENSQMLNQALLDKGYAEPNAETQHFLQLELNIIDTFNDIKEAEAHIEEFYKHLQDLSAADDALKPKENQQSISKSIKEEEKKQKKAIEHIAAIETKIEEIPNEFADMPALKSLHKRPRTTWHQTEFMLFISIHAPDVVNYTLEVQENSIRYVANVNDEYEMLIINLLGTIQTECVQHQLRGVNVIIRLLKSIFVKWPRLLQSTDKPVWLSYNLDIDAPQESLVLPELIYRYVNGSNNLPDGFDTEQDDSDIEGEMFQTYNPIRNRDDDYDPTGDL